MIIIMRAKVSDAEVNAVIQKLEALGLQANVSRGVERTVIGAIGEDRHLHQPVLKAMPGVSDVVPIVKPYKIVARESHPENTVIDINGILLGGNTIQVIGGPCSVETQPQMDLAAQGVAAAGCRLMRGGAFKPRTSPYAFQGAGLEGLTMFRQAAKVHNLPIVTELMDVRTMRFSMSAWYNFVQRYILQCLYGIPKNGGCRWIDQDNFLCLIDGDNAVNGSFYDACQSLFVN